MFDFKKRTAPEESTSLSTALLEPDIEAETTPEPEMLVPVMERAKAAITSVDCDIDYYEATDRLARLTREQHSLLGIEKEAKVALDQRISDVKRDVIKIKAYKEYGTDTKRLDPEVLTWRKREPILHDGVSIPLPEVALFGLDDSAYVISTDGWSSHGTCTPYLPWSLTESYRDIFEALNLLDTRSSYTRGHSICAVFEGVVPAETKEKIRKAQSSKVFEQIRVIAEADWALDVRPHPRLADPIIVGLVNDEMWVIDVFDPTPLEDYIAKEFTT